MNKEALKFVALFWFVMIVICSVIGLVVHLTITYNSPVPLLAFFGCILFPTFSYMVYQSEVESQKKERE